MSSGHIFWFIAGAMSAVAAVAVALPLLNRMTLVQGARPKFIAVVAVTTLLIGSLGLYRLWGTPDAISLNGKESALVSQMAHPGAGTDTEKADSIEQATEKLAKRLTSQGGSAADWNLLAQSYDFLGRGKDAEEARKRAGTPGKSDAAIASPAPSPEAAATLALAEKARIAHDYKKALELYANAAKRNFLDADGWANYADAAASASGGKLEGAPSRYIDAALKLDPDHPKALWLQASLLHEQKRYGDAVEVWRHLANALPAGSPDVKIIEANIAEAQRLSGDSNVKTAQINGTIDIDPKLRAKAAAGQVLFVFAKSVDSPGPPLAVVRTTVGQWPVQFSLNDSQAMMPQRKLSDFRTVTVEARVSANGQPLAQPGDLHGVTGTLDPKSDKPVHVVIREVIG